MKDSLISTLNNSSMIELVAQPC